MVACIPPYRNSSKIPRITNAIRGIIILPLPAAEANAQKRYQRRKTGQRTNKLLPLVLQSPSHKHQLFTTSLRATIMEIDRKKPRNASTKQSKRTCMQTALLQLHPPCSQEQHGSNCKSHDPIAGLTRARQRLLLLHEGMPQTIRIPSIIRITPGIPDFI